MISIVTVTYDSYDFLDLLLESLDLYSSISYEIIIIDNSTKKQQVEAPNSIYIPMSKNIGHGAGLNEGVKFAHYPFVMFLDVDTHVLCRDWEQPFIQLMEQFDVVGGRGVPIKPIRPACMFLKREYAVKYDWRSTEGYQGIRGGVPGFDVAIEAYYKMIEDGVKIKLIESQPNRYNTIVGEEWCINEKALIYHHWHGAHIKERQIDFPKTDLVANKNLLFSQIPWRLP